MLTLTNPRPQVHRARPRVERNGVGTAINEVQATCEIDCERHDSACKAPGVAAAHGLMDAYGCCTGLDGNPPYRTSYCRRAKSALSPIDPIQRASADAAGRSRLAHATVRQTNSPPITRDPSRRGRLARLHQACVIVLPKRRPLKARITTNTRHPRPEHRSATERRAHAQSAPQRQMAPQAGRSTQAG